MTNLSIVGAQWGDEGKGKIVDLLTGCCDVVARFAGGSNAGHTLVIDGQKIVVHLLPSGVVHRDKTCVLGSGMVIDPAGLLAEIGELRALGLAPQPGRLWLSDRAQLVLPYHRAIDHLREQGPAAIGTTRRGIGPAYEDKVARRGLRVCDLLDERRLRSRLTTALAAANAQIETLGGESLVAEQLIGELSEQADKLRPFVVDTSRQLHDAIERGERVLFEGAQGVMLDVDHGTYPFVTSSTTLAGGACAGAGVGPRQLGICLGVTKAYVTRVGEGPFPSELTGADGDRLREAGGEFGATTGRPRRCGWLDLPALRHAARVVGLDGLVVTKLDVLAQLDRFCLCTGYRLDGQQIDAIPADSEDLARVEPVYRELEGFGADLAGVSDYQQLPRGARELVELIEAETALEVCVLSVGPARDQTIIRAESAVWSQLGTVPTAVAGEPRPGMRV